VQYFRPPPARRPLIILSVDAEPAGLLTRKTLLENAGYHVLSALNADQAFQIFNANHIDLVVTDHLLPGATGTEMARTMKMAKPEIPVLLLTGTVDRSPDTEHVDKFINKAEGPDTLLEAIAEVTSGKAADMPSTPLLVKKHPALSAEDRNQCATMAHEINNPLESLLNLLYLADAENEMSETAHGYLVLAREEVRRIAHIVQAALHGCSDDEALGDADVPQLLWSVIEFYKSRFASRGISIETRGCFGGNLAVYSGPLRQLFSNLLLNAADAIPYGGRIHARVSNACEWSGQQRRGLRVTFADNGCGIPTQILGRIFEPCFSTKGAHGSGLGLSLVMNVVRKHDGSLHVRSSTEQGHSGSIFSIFLPVRRPGGPA